MAWNPLESIANGMRGVVNPQSTNTFTTPQYFYGSGSDEEKQFRAMYEYHYGPGSYAKDVLAGQLKMDPMSAKSAEAYKGEMLANSNAQSAENINDQFTNSRNLVAGTKIGLSPLNSIASKTQSNDTRQMQSNALNPNVNRLMANKDIADQTFANTEARRVAINLANQGYIRDQEQMQLGLAQTQGDMANTRSNALNSMQNAAAAAQQKSDQYARDVANKNEAARLQALGTLAVQGGNYIANSDKENEEAKNAGQAAGQGAANSNPSDKNNKKSISKLIIGRKSKSGCK